MPLEFEPQRADLRLKNLGMETKAGVVKSYGFHFDPYDGDELQPAAGGEWRPNQYRYDYVKLSKDLQEYWNLGDMDAYLDIVSTFAREDLFFLCYFVLDMPVNHPFLIARIYDVQLNQHMTCDLWAREHWKSTIITVADTVFDIIKNQEERIAIFSHTRDAAKKHVRVIKTILESNEVLKLAYPHIFYSNPQSKGAKGAPKWNEDALMVKRNTVLRESTVEAHGLDHMPTGAHFTKLKYDDIVDPNSTTTNMQIKKNIDAFRLSDNLGTRGTKKRVIGTRYKLNDPYLPIIEDKAWRKRVFPAEVDVTGKRMLKGIPVFLTREELDEKYKNQREFIYSSQMLQDPTAKSEYSFNPNWVETHNGKRPYLNYYIIVDPAKNKGESHDYTVMVVIGTDAFRNFWMVDVVRDKLSLKQKWEKLSELAQKWGVRDIGYEEYGMQNDIEYLEEKIDETGVRLHFIPLKGNLRKEDRIKKLKPYFEQRRFLIPVSLVYEQVNGELVDIIYEFKAELLSFPYSVHDDLIDATARICDSAMNVQFPHSNMRPLEEERNFESDPLDYYKDREEEVRNWMLQ